jgi:hypothetical protein
VLGDADCVNHLMMPSFLNGHILARERKDRLTGVQAAELQLESDDRDVFVGDFCALRKLSRALVEIG